MALYDVEGTDPYYYSVEEIVANNKMALDEIY